MAAISFDLPQDVLSALKRGPDDLAREMRVVMAIYWYLRTELSQSKAAGLAGRSRAAFIEE
ncbi:MAG TPA: UPF0175 family protein [Tepidisphaeraceae bacterium]|jgi:predicted HTH domain antitoxin